MINNKTDIIGYMQLFFKFWPIGSPEEAYYMEYKCDFAKPLNEDFFKYVLGSFGKICEEQDEKKHMHFQYLLQNYTVININYHNVQKRHLPILLLSCRLLLLTVFEMRNRYHSKSLNQ